MKPDVTASEPTAVDEADVDPCELFVAVGMLVLESRLPTPSVKGRRDGPHCPPALGHWAAHECDPSLPQCERAARVQKQMQMLWRNHIPMCIEVLLFSGCIHGEHRANTTDIAPPDVSDSCVLLEQWTIQNVTRKTSSELSGSARCLFQAVRSYLHFSQLSAWLNATHGTAPRCIGYRVSPPGEFCTSRFTVTPELHTFPSAVIGKSGHLRAVVQHLPRLPDIPKPLCHDPHPTREQHSSDAGASRDGSGSMVVRKKSPDLSEERSRSSSPRFMKPNVLSHLTQPLDEAASAAAVSSSDRLSESETLDGGNPTTKLSSSNEIDSAPVSKDLGAIPKRPDVKSLKLVTDSEDASPLVSRLKPSVKSSSSLCNGDLTDLVDDPPFVLPPSVTAKEAYYASRRRSMPPRKDTTGTDSDGSSPDFDALLAKTLTNNTRLDPMSPQEMEVYLSSLYPQRMSKFKSSANGLLSARLKTMKSFELGPSNSFTFADCPRPSKKSADSCFPSEDQDLEQVWDRKNVGYCTPPGEKSQSFGNGMSVQSYYYKSLRQCDSDGNNLSATCDEADDVRRIFGKVLTTNDLEEQDGTLCGNDVANGFSQPTTKTSSTNGYVRRLFDNSSTPSYPAKFVVGSEQFPNEIPEDETTTVSRLDSNIRPSTVSTMSNAESPSRRTPETSPTSPTALHKSISCPNKKSFGSKVPGFHKANSLLRTVMKRELHAAPVAEVAENAGPHPTVPSPQDVAGFRNCLRKSANAMFHTATGLPLQSSPAPIKRASSSSFDYDGTLTSVRSIKNSFSCVNLNKQCLENGSTDNSIRRTYSTSAPATTNCLLGNFEESMLNGRIEPSGVVEGFTVDIGASGSFCPKHVTLPVTAFFFSLSDDNAPSPYLGHISLDSLQRRGYHVPNKGTIQVTLFNPNKTVVKMFIVVYDLSDMPPNCQTFLRQRMLYMPVKGSPSDTPNVVVYLRYLIHLRFASSKSGKIYLHTDIRVIFARDKFELDQRVASYELRSFTEGPENPKYAPKRRTD